LLNEKKVTSVIRLVRPVRLRLERRTSVTASIAYDYDARKTVVVLAGNLEPGIAMNVLGHLTLSIGAHGGDELMGRHELVDASGIAHVGISRYPVIVTKAKPTQLRRLVEVARREADVLLVDYPEHMLQTGHDDELTAALGRVSEADITYLGAALYGDSEVVSQLTGRFSLWS
jgi:hypothetical protein